MSAPQLAPTSPGVTSLPLSSEKSSFSVDEESSYLSRSGKIPRLEFKKIFLKMRDNLKGSVNNKTINGQLIQTVWQPEALSDGEQLQLQTLGQCEL